MMKEQLTEAQAQVRREAMALQQQKSKSRKNILDACSSEKLAPGAAPTRPWHHMPAPGHSKKHSSSGSSAGSGELSQRMESIKNGPPPVRLNPFKTVTADDVLGEISETLGKDAHVVSAAL